MLVKTVMSLQSATVAHTRPQPWQIISITPSTGAADMRPFFEVLEPQMSISLSSPGSGSGVPGKKTSRQQATSRKTLHRAVTA